MIMEFNRRTIISSLILASMLLVTLPSAAKLFKTNHITGLYDCDKLDNCPQVILCVQNADHTYTPWDYGHKLDPFLHSGNPYWWMADVRIGGCSLLNDAYLGQVDSEGDYMPFIKDQYTHPMQLHNFKINSSDVTGQIGFSKMAVNDDFPENTHTKPWYTGVNLSGLEFSTAPNNSTLPDISHGGPDLEGTLHFLSQGANTIRLPIRWSYLQPYGDGSDSFDAAVFQDYFDNLVIPTLTTLTQKGYYVILDLHSYMHYSTVGSEVAGCRGGGHKCPEGALVIDSAPYVSIWSKMWAEIQKHPEINPHFLMFDLVNEPSEAAGETLTAHEAFKMQADVINDLQKNHFPGKYLVEGMHFSGLHSWEHSGNAHWNAFTRDNFIRHGIDSNMINNQIIINVHQYLDSDYSGTHETCQQNLHTIGEHGFNLDMFVTYLHNNQFKAMVTEFGVGDNEQSCKEPLREFLQYMENNADTTGAGGFVGWTAWSTGHGWHSLYELLITPMGWKADILKDYYLLPAYKVKH